MDNLKKRRLKLRLTVIAVMIVCFVAGFTPSLEFVFSRDFDAAGWKAGSEFTRGMMARNLYESHLLIGKCRGEVESLLGKPDSSNIATLNYSLEIGNRVLFSKWLWHLIVQLDDHGVVKEVIMSD